MSKRVSMSNGRVYVCSMTKVVDTVRSSGARSLVTILTAGASLVRPFFFAESYSI